MIGLVLCAGYGTRLGRITKDKPKCMVKVVGKPVLEHIVEHLERFGVSPIVVNTHYKPLTIMKHFGPRILYTYEQDLLGEEGTIYSIATMIDRDFTVVMNGDTLTNLDLNMMFRMSNGRNIKYMDGKTYAGTKILSPLFFQGNKTFAKYEDKNAFWIDIGTPKGLARAKKQYEKTDTTRQN